jgi:DNA-binding transcriptional LysR family regulator
MDRRWLPLNALRAFEAVGKQLSFTAAANALFVSQSAVSRHVIILEQLLGVQLFERRPHQLVLTEAGKALLPVVTKSFDRLEQTLREITQTGPEPTRVLRVQLPPSFAQNLAVPILRDFRRQVPDIILDIESPHHVGPPTEDVDLAVTYSKPQVTEYVTDLLWMVRLTVLCAPSIAEECAGLELDEFLRRNELVHVKLDDQPRHALWEMFLRQNGITGVDVARGLVFDTANLAAQYALSGAAVALLDPMLFAEELRAGRLVQPFAAWLDDGYGYYLTIHPDDLSDDSIALFRAWLIRRLAAARGPGAAEGNPSGSSTVVPLPRRTRL